MGFNLLCLGRVAEGKRKQSVLMCALVLHAKHSLNRTFSRVSCPCEECTQQALHLGHYSSNRTESLTAQEPVCVLMVGNRSHNLLLWLVVLIDMPPWIV